MFGCKSQKNPRRSVHAEAQVDKTTSRRKPVDLLLGPLPNVDGSLVKAIMQDVSWVGEWWMMMIQNEITMWVFVNNMTFTFRRSDCDSKKASDNEFKGGRGLPRYLVTWNTRYTWVLEHHVSSCLTMDLGYLKSRGLVVCQSLLLHESHDSWVRQTISQVLKRIYVGR